MTTLTDRRLAMWRALDRRTALMAALISLTLSLAWACGGGSEQAAVQDSVAVDTALMMDTVRAVPPADSAADSTTVEPSAADVAIVLDSLRSQLTRIESQVDRLRPGGSTLLDALPAERAAQGAGLDAESRVQQTAQDVQHFALRSVWAAIILVAALFFIRATAWLLGVLSERSAQRRLLFKRMIPIVRLVVWGLVIFYVISSVFAVDRAGLLAGTAAVGVGIGFAAQGVIKNVLGGLIIIFDQPFQVGDKIKVGGTYGEVMSIGMRATRIVTPDDNLVSVPNAQVVEDQVANANAGALDCQVVVDLYLPGCVDVAKAKAIALNAATNSQYAYLGKPVVVNVKDEFRETFLTHLLVKVYVIDTRYEFALASDVTEAAKSEFLREGMIPSYLDAAEARHIERNWAVRGATNE